MLHPRLLAEFQSKIPGFYSFGTVIQSGISITDVAYRRYNEKNNILHEKQANKQKKKG
jgi:hypothetical protein